jgi:hypothetical protein
MRAAHFDESTLVGWSVVVGKLLVISVAVSGAGEFHLCTWELSSRNEC